MGGKRVRRMRERAGSVCTGSVAMSNSMEPNEVPVIHSLFHTRVFRPTLSTHILGIIQAVK